MAHISPRTPAAIVTLCCFLLSTASSCEKTSDLPQEYWGEVSAERDGLAWSPEIIAYRNKPYGQGIDVEIERYTTRGFRRETLLFFKVPDVVGVSPLAHTTSRIIDSLTGAFYATSLDDGDVLGDVYQLLDTDFIDDYVELERIEGDEVWGSFQVTFERDPFFPVVDSSGPDTLVFRRGTFHTRVTVR